MYLTSAEAQKWAKIGVKIPFGETSGENKIKSKKEQFFMSKNNTEDYYKTLLPYQPDILSVAKVQQILGISRHFTYELITTHQIKAMRIGNSYKIPKVCLIEYILNNLGKIGENSR